MTPIVSIVSTTATTGEVVVLPQVLAQNDVDWNEERQDTAERHGYFPKLAFTVDLVVYTVS